MKYLISILVLILIIACPNPPEETICGQGMVLTNDACECISNAHLTEVDESCACDSLYHWNEDMTSCLPDTTSHEFSWILDTLGIYGSVLNDASIIDRDDIWVVGQIRINEPNAVIGSRSLVMYNAAHWDGSKWSFQIVGDGSNIHAVYAFSTDDIWMVNGEDIFRYNGENFEIVWQADTDLYGVNQVQTVLGIAPSNIYFVGQNGIIVHFDGSTFTHIRTGIDTDFRDIAAATDGEHVFIIGRPISGVGEDVVLRSRDNPVFWERLEYPLTAGLTNTSQEFHSLTVAGNLLYIAKSFELWQINLATGLSRLTSDIAHIYEQYNFLLSNSESDVFFGGAKFNYIHYNGSSYQYADPIQDQYNTIEMLGGDFKGNIAVMVGGYDLNLWPGAALVARGYRN